MQTGRCRDFSHRGLFPNKQKTKKQKSQGIGAGGLCSTPAEFFDEGDEKYAKGVEYAPHQNHNDERCYGYSVSVEKGLTAFARENILHVSK